MHPNINIRLYCSFMTHSEIVKTSVFIFFFLYNYILLIVIPIPTQVPNTNQCCLACLFYSTLFWSAGVLSVSVTECDTGTDYSAWFRTSAHTHTTHTHTTHTHTHTHTAECRHSNRQCLYHYQYMESTFFRKPRTEMCREETPKTTKPNPFPFSGVTLVGFCVC